MIILGLNAYHGDASAALMVDGELIAAVDEERFNRQKHCAGFPSLAVREVLRQGGVTAEKIDHVAISRDPAANLYKKVLFSLNKGTQLPKLVLDRLANVSRVRSADEALCQTLGVPRKSFKAKFHNVEHHKAHIGSSYYFSGFESAACLSIDGFGDFASTMTAVGRGYDVSVIERTLFPHSVGLFYTAITQFCGFNKYGEEWKLMGLAPYGKPTYVEQLRRLIGPRPDGCFELNLDYFIHHTEGVDMTWDEGSPNLGPVYSPKLIELLGQPRDPESNEFFGKWADLAQSCQVVYEEIFFHILQNLFRITTNPRLCLAGGCALNSVANGKILERTPFKEIFIQPAAADNGTSVGAAAHVAFSYSKKDATKRMNHAYYGPSFTDAQIEEALAKADLGPEVSVSRLDDQALFEKTAQAISEGRVVGWFQGAMEFGPRALGNRSIVADPRRHDMKDILNQRIKHRETFRPFAPSIIEEKVGEVFERSEPSPFMILVFKVREGWREKLPAVTHVDHTGRVQTVNQQTNPRYHALISAFYKKTEVPVLLNTSFNEHEPIVTTPQDAINCFVRTKMDVLAMGNIFVERKQ